MGIVESYSWVSHFFGLWVYAIKLPMRRAQLVERTPPGGRALIVSPPTDPAMRLIVQSNQPGKTTLACFSGGIEQRAIRKSTHWDATHFHTRVVPFCRLPFPDATFRTVFANCFFDFFPAKDLQPVLRELFRVLKDRPMDRLGFPVRYTLAQRSAEVS